MKGVDIVLVIFYSSKKVVLENFWLHTVVSELFYKTCYISKANFLFHMKYLIVYTLSSEISANVSFCKKKMLESPMPLTAIWG